ncbi:MAG TPA: tetratricopeptide repeat protein [Pyrinomonadaceae bacterium]|nr:tetratricopeptide repeat protein [Pyrinomonadaceae bacterium]
MKKLAVLFFLILFSFTTFAQKPKPTKRTASPAKPIAANVGNEKAEFEKAVGQKNAAERIAALQKFVENFSKSNEKTRALELVVSARAEIADEKLRLNDTASGIEFFKLAVKDAPNPVSDKLFTEILLQIPTNLFFRGQQAKAIEVARLVEQKVQGNANQLLGLATFYIGTENAAEARRLADKAIAINPNLPAAYQTLGLASRLNFQLDEAANAYAKALELDANSTVSKRSLAEMKRATGKTDDAIRLYREILAKDESDAAALTGLALSLFDAGKRTEAEAETVKLLEKNPNNLPLLVGAAYWYAAHEDGAKAVELAQKAVTVEPRYTWAHIALARGLLLQKRPLDAEKALLTARQYGNFPTLDYEIASVRLAAGFYREAAEELKKSFTLKEGLLQTRLGGRVLVEAKNFIELLSLERRASIFELLAADSSENADKIKSLLEFSQKLESADANESAVSEAADEFLKGDDKMKVHRQIFVANRLLENKKALPKVLELTKAAVGGVDSAMDVANPSAAILADELYDSRQIAMIRGQLIIVPDIPRQTLLNILRGRIEEISGWTLYRQGRTGEAVVRLKRAVSVLPEKSAWWRGSLWRLGSALDADGKSKEALDAYIKSYTNGEQDGAKRIVIELVYQKLNGSLDGLDQKIGAKPVTTSAEPITRTEQAQAVAQKSVKEIPAAQTSPAPELKATPKISTELKTVTKFSPSLAAEQTAAADAEKKSTPELKTKISPAVLPTESNTEKKPTIENQNPVTTSDKSSKPLFEPVVIIVPKSETAKLEVKPDENVAEEEPLENKSKSVTRRQRVISEKKSDLQSEETAQCKITVSQENISLVKGGGNLGILVGFEEAGNLKQLMASSSSPNDIEVTLEPDIGAQSGRAFFVVKSISSNKGIYTVTFDAPCGKKNVSVKVR